MISGIFENCIGTTNLEATLSYWAELGDREIDRGQFSAEQAKQLYGHDAALNFGLETEIEHDERYKRAREFYDVVTGLWDSFADDVFIRDVESGIYFDPEKLHVLNYRGKYLSVRGPLHIARPIQGYPVIVQAGASDAGRQLAGGSGVKTAIAVLTPSARRKRIAIVFRSDFSSVDRDCFCPPSSSDNSRVSMINENW